MTQLVDVYSRWLSTSNGPNLFVNADPGTILTGAQREFCRAWPNQRELTVKGCHFIQEDAPAEIGRAVADWMGALGGSRNYRFPGTRDLDLAISHTIVTTDCSDPN